MAELSIKCQFGRNRIPQHTLKRPKKHRNIKIFPKVTSHMFVIRKLFIYLQPFSEKETKNPERIREFADVAQLARARDL